MSETILPNYYGSAQERQGKNIYELWEKGIPFGDSITPSGFSTKYILRIIDIITTNTPTGGSIVSLGSGNGFIEARLMEKGYHVLCVDCNEEAVAITESKGLQSLCSDFYDLSPSIFSNGVTIYADGFFGHLYDSTTGLARPFRHLNAMCVGKTANLVISNDAPVNGSLHVEAHASVPDFSYLSPHYVSQQFKAGDFRETHSEIFEYNRPLSGVRKRTICVGKKEY